ncbi:low-complexity tail membrane protein [Geitlerinema sp. PCC 9228]|uniref:low-complexity tail membrane protein n=1 Tax=Geitlerinema sp. PCC 9228 TaxID=111611 RepID=UPI0008F9BCD2|nr:low-complexity tail membrane protein [Geitlerinema sp. PCC 9228]
MNAFRLDPYLWLHLTGIAAVPLFLGICLLGLAVGDPGLPVAVEFALVSLPGLLLVLWMQVARPFYIYSVLVVATQPQQLSAQKRQILNRFLARKRRGFLGWLLPLLVAVAIAIVLWPIYLWAPVASSVVAWMPPWRGVGLLVAAIAFFLVNLFTQVPFSVLEVLLTPAATFTNTPPLSVEEIQNHFTIVGWQLQRGVLPVKEPPETAPSKPTS